MTLIVITIMHFMSIAGKIALTILLTLVALFALLQMTGGVVSIALCFSGEGSSQSLSQGLANLGVGALILGVCVKLFTGFVLGNQNKKDDASAISVSA